MTERLADVRARIAGIRQLGAIVRAMRGIAAARAQQARGQLAAVDRYAASVAAAIAQALSLLPPRRHEQASVQGRLALVLFCAEQGFAGAFSERVLDAAGADLATAELFIAGTRGGTSLMEQRIKPGWLGAMPSHSPAFPSWRPRLGRPCTPAWHPAAFTGWMRSSVGGNQDAAPGPFG